MKVKWTAIRNCYSVVHMIISIHSEIFFALTESKAETDGASSHSQGTEKSPSAVDFFDFDDNDGKDDYDAVDVDETIVQPSTQELDHSSNDSVIPTSTESSQEREISTITGKSQSL